MHTKRYNRQIPQRTLTNNLNTRQAENCTTSQLPESSKRTRTTLPMHTRPHRTRATQQSNEQRQRLLSLYQKHLRQQPSQKDTGRHRRTQQAQQHDRLRTTIQKQTTSTSNTKTSTRRAKEPLLIPTQQTKRAPRSSLRTTLLQQRQTNIKSDDKQVTIKQRQPQIT